MNLNILIVGVGGQGTLLASRVLGAVAEIKGLDCKLSEVHGMAQRGGSVVTFVRIAEEVFSPVISAGEADVVLAFEKLEALRYAHFLRAGGKMIVNSQEIMPMPVITGAEKYPVDAIGTLKAAGLDTLALDALSLAASVGNPKAVNIIMIGTLLRIFGISLADAQAALKKAVPAKIFAANEAALELSYKN